MTWYFHLKLTKSHLIELMIFEVWTDKFARACTAGISPAMDELISEGLMYKDDSRSDPLCYISIAEEGRRALRDVGPAAVVEAILEFGKLHLLPLCESKITLADLPLLLASKSELVRNFALEKYKELGDGTDLQAHQLVADTSDDV